MKKTIKMLLKRKALTKKYTYERVEEAIRCVDCRYFRKIGELGGRCNKFKIQFASTNIDMFHCYKAGLITKFYKKK